MELEKLRKRVDEFNDYGELDMQMMMQYVQDVRQVQKRIGEAETELQWINKVSARNPELMNYQFSSVIARVVFSVLFRRNNCTKCQPLLTRILRT